MSDFWGGGLSAVLPGMYKIVELPAANQNRARYAFVTDLGGGADMVLSDGLNWKRIRRGVLVTLPSTSVVIKALSSPSLIKFNTTGLTSLLTVNISTDQLYSGWEGTLIFAGLLGIGGSLGLNLDSSVVSGISFLGNRWYDIMYDGTTVQIVRTAGLT